MPPRSDQTKALLRFDVEQYVETTLGVRNRANRSDGGTELVCDCPVCGKSKVLWINPRDRNWVCYKCAEGGGIVKLVARVEGCSVREARSIVAAGEHARAQTDDELINRWRSSMVPPSPPELGLPGEFIPVWDEATGILRWHPYLTERGVTRRVAGRYGLGFCESGRYAGRIVCPVHVDGVVRSFTARAWDPSVVLRYDTPLGNPASELLYGYDEAEKRGDLVVVEGPFDVIAMACHGYRSCVGLMGKSMSDAKLNLIRRLRPTSVTLLADSDDPKGYIDFVRAAIRLTDAMPPRVEVKVARLAEKFDPGNAPKDEILRALRYSRPPTAEEAMRAVKNSQH